MAKELRKALTATMIKDVPAYGNKFFYSLGFLSMISFVVLIITGIILAFYGPNWWLTTTPGSYMRSVHLWATQAFVTFIILHVLVVFFSSGFKKPRRLTWVFGVIMLFLVILQSEFGYLLRNDYSSQWRALQGADFYNGTHLGYWLNVLNNKQIYGIHLVVLPLILMGVLFLHYALVRFLGVARPYRPEVKVAQVPANHTVLFIRGGVLVLGILILALILPSPLVPATTITSVAKQDPALMAQTLMGEYTAQSDTASYVDDIAPYSYNTQQVYVNAPYRQLVASDTTLIDQLNRFNVEPAALRASQIKAANDYFNNWNGTSKVPLNNPLVIAIAQLVVMAKAGLYQPAVEAINAQATPADDTTYVLRFLADSGVLDAHATSISLQTDQYGMLHEEAGHALGAWWLAPIGLLDKTVLSNDSNGDRDGGIIFGTFFILLMAFPYIPWVNQLPDKLKVYKFIWRTKP